MPGQTIKLDATASTDPDGDDLDFHWWIYQEAGTYSDELSLPDDSADSTTLAIPDDAHGSELHVILTVRDRSEIVPMYDYRRIVISVEESGN